MVRCLKKYCDDEALEDSAYCARHSTRRSMELGYAIDDDDESGSSDVDLFESEVDSDDGIFDSLDEG
jgi:hypothetical protein